VALSERGRESTRAVLVRKRKSAKRSERTGVCRCLCCQSFAYVSSRREMSVSRPEASMLLRNQKKKAAAAMPRGAAAKEAAAFARCYQM